MEEQKFLDISGKSVDEAVFKGLTELGATLDEVHIEILKEETKGVLGIGARQAVVRLTVRNIEEMNAIYAEEAAQKEAQAVESPYFPQSHERRERSHDERSQGGRDPERGRGQGGRGQGGRGPERGRGRNERGHGDRNRSDRGRDGHGGRDFAPRYDSFVDDDPLYDVPSDNPAAVFLQGMLSHMGVNSKLAVREEEDALRIKIQSDSMGILIGHRGETLDSMQYLCSLVLNKGKREYTRLTLDTENYRVKREETLTRLAERLAEQVANTGEPVALEPMNPYERRILHSSLQSHSGVFTYSEGEEPNRRVIIALKQ